MWWSMGRLRAGLCTEVVFVAELLCMHKLEYSSIHNGEVEGGSLLVKVLHVQWEAEVEWSL